ncbi:hypothetical protein TWF730_008476 [Orbilia blumenaviensis]|uniref:tyrosine--tRNA ligase n=1 Tax=Orbilia blumenaviensis TaxID=1796055 RepID=A0AAV9V6A9_9PEZI
MTEANFTMDLDRRLDLITRGLEHVDGVDLQLIKTTLQNKKHPSIFWGVAPTGRPHIGYLVPFVKFAEFVEAGLKVKVFLADLYAFLVNYKHPRYLVDYRQEYYACALAAVFEAVTGLPASTIEFHRETSHASTPDFVNDVYELLRFTSIEAARSPNDELAKTKMLSPLMVPILQALAERDMNCDFQLGGLDQMGLYDYGEKHLPKIGYNKKHAHMMNRLLPGLTGTKMSASDPSSKIDLLDPPEIVHKKIMGASCDEKATRDNPILALLEVVLVPIRRLQLERLATKSLDTRGGTPRVKVDISEGYVFSIVVETGASHHYVSYEAIEKDFLDGVLSPEVLKTAVAKAMNQLLAPIRKSFETNTRWQEVLKLAYPESEERQATLHTASFFESVKDHPEVWTHGPFGPFRSAQSFNTDFIDPIVRPKTDMLLYAIIDKCRPPTTCDRDGALAGLIAYIGASPTNLCTEIGFVVTLPQFQRTHVTSNAVGLLLKFALNPPNEGGLGFRRVQWMTSSKNYASIKTAEKMGFTKEGLIRWDRLYPNGVASGKESNDKPLRVDGKVSHMNESDLGRDSVMFSMCWDDWFLSAKREHVAERMARR